MHVGNRPGTEKLLHAPSGGAGSIERLLIAGEDAIARNHVYTLGRWAALAIHEVHTAESADALRAALQRNAYQLILLDADMPPVEGLPAYDWVRARRPDCALILYGRHETMHSLRQSAAAAALGYLVKPISPHALQCAVTRAIKESRHACEESTLCVLGATLLARFAQALSTGSRAVAIAAVEEIRQTLADLSPPLAILRRIYFLLAHQILSQGSAFPPAEAQASQLYAALELHVSIDALHDDLAARVDRLLPPCEEETAYSCVVRSVLKEIDRALGNEALSIEFLASRVYLTPTYLAAVFKKETGATIGQYIMEQRMQRAKALLLDRSLRLYQVARQVGYQDANYFSRIFKKQEGVTPSAFRAREMQ